MFGALKVKSGDQIEAERSRLVADLEAAKSRLAALEAARLDLRESAGPAELRANSDAQADQIYVLESIEAKLALNAKAAAARVAEEDRLAREASYAAGQRAQVAGRAALRVYSKAAAEIAGAMRDLLAAEEAINSANAFRPENAKKLDSAEPSNASPMVFADNGFPLSLATGARSLMDTICLPRPGTRTEFFYGSIDAPQQERYR